VYLEKINRESRGSMPNHFHASAVWEWPATESASQTFKSGKNELMRVFVFRKLRAELTSTPHERSGHRGAFPTFAVHVLHRMNNQSANRGA
jgi:hypothetical protein